VKIWKRQNIIFYLKVLIKKQKAEERLEEAKQKGK
jgi:hypothetical protein